MSGELGPYSVAAMLLSAMSFLTILGTTFPAMFGMIRTRALMSGLLGALGMMAAANLLSAIGHDRDMGIMLYVTIALIAIGAAALASAPLRALDRIAHERGRRRSMRDDPVEIVRVHAPEMLRQVEDAMLGVARLKALAPRADHADVADALALADVRLPEVVRAYRNATDAALPQERPELARLMAEAVINIGTAAERERAVLAARIADELRTQVRFVADRTGAGGEALSV